jgi:hypothetical protein
MSLKINAYGLELDFVYPEIKGGRASIEWCEAEIKDQPVGWRARRGYGGNCQRHATYNVNGKKLCRMHAGNEVLDQLFKNHKTHFYRVSNQPSVQRKP